VQRRGDQTFRKAFRVAKQEVRPDQLPVLVFTPDGNTAFGFLSLEDLLGPDADHSPGPAEADAVIRAAERLSAAIRTTGNTECGKPSPSQPETTQDTGVYTSDDQMAAAANALDWVADQFSETGRASDDGLAALLRDTAEGLRIRGFKPKPFREVFARREKQ